MSNVAGGICSIALLLVPLVGGNLAPWRGCCFTGNATGKSREWMERAVSNVAGEIYSITLLFVPLVGGGGGVI